MSANPAAAPPSHRPRAPGQAHRALALLIGALLVVPVMLARATDGEPGEGEGANKTVRVPSRSGTGSNAGGPVSAGANEPEEAPGPRSNRNEPVTSSAAGEIITSCTGSELTNDPFRIPFCTRDEDAIDPVPSPPVKPDVGGPGALPRKPPGKKPPAGGGRESKGTTFKPEQDK